MFCLYAKTKHFNNTFYFLLDLMTVKGTKCEFTLDWVKNVHDNEKFHNTF